MEGIHVIVASAASSAEVASTPLLLLLRLLLFCFSCAYLLLLPLCGCPYSCFSCAHAAASASHLCRSMSWLIPCCFTCCLCTGVAALVLALLVPVLLLLPASHLCVQINELFDSLLLHLLPVEESEERNVLTAPIPALLVPILLLWGQCAAWS